MKLSSQQIAEQLARITNKSPDVDLNISLDEIESFGDSKSLKLMLENVQKYNLMLQQRITLVNEALSSVIPFTKENLYLFCAYTGSGKSTVAANISYPLWKQGKKTLVISNEESEQDVIFRIACIELGLSFNDYKKGDMPMEQQVKCLKLFPEITKYVKVLDVTYKDGVTTKIEGVKQALESVKKQADYSCVMIDYFQLVKYSLKDTKKTAYENLNDLRVWIGQYIKSSTMPVVLFAQLYSQSKRQSKGADIDNRIKDCSAIVEPATVIIEVIPNYDNATSEFIIHKDRFGRAGQKVVCGFEKGRYIKLSPEELAEREMQGKLKAQNDKMAKLEAMIKPDVE